MADRYIDVFEVGEYGEHFLREATRLAGLSPLVDIQALRNYVERTMLRVNRELERLGVVRSDLRAGRGDTSTAAPALRQELERFYNFLGGLDEEVKVDRKAFFKEGNLGALAAMKPADLVSKATEVLSGFAVPANENLPEREKRQQKLIAAREALRQALGQRDGGRNVSIIATGELTAARQEFLTAYNSVAKRMVQGLLISLGRGNEYPMYFKDLLVNEDGPGADDPADGEDTTDKPPQPDTGIPSR